MARADAAGISSNGNKTLGVCALLLLSTFAGIILAPSAAAAISGDLEISKSKSPLENVTYTSWNGLSIEVEVSNTGFFFNQNTRTIQWYICAGDLDENQCYNDKDGSGSGELQPIPIGTSVNLTFTNMFSPDGGSGIHTLVLKFQNADNEPSNDLLKVNFFLSQNLVDAIIPTQDPTSELTDMAVYDDELIFNTNHDYQMSVSGKLSNCLACGFSADFGWKLINSTGEEVANSSLNYASMPYGSNSDFSRALPPLNYSEEGRYTFEFGLVSSSGTPDGDMNSFNDMQSVDVIFDDSIDLQVKSMFPKYSPGSSTYFYGNDSVAVEIANNGNMTIFNPVIRFTVMDLTDEVESVEDCTPESILPGQVYSCIYDLNHLGDKNLKVSVPENLIEGTDVKPADNILTQTSEIIAGDINPLIDQSNFYGVYNTGDVIEFTARSAPTAAAPLQYTWWTGGIFQLGSGQAIEVDASTIGLGDHFISLRITDSLGILESKTITITVFNNSDISIGQWLDGSAVTRAHAAGTGSYDLPLPGAVYGPGEGLEALVIMSLDVFATGEETDIGLESISFDLNISQMLPDNIPRSSIRVHQLFGVDQIDWDPLYGDNSYELIDQDTIRVNLTQTMDLLIVGELPPPDITPGQLEIALLPDGGMRLDWDPQGDLENPYFGGWKIYKVTGIPGGSSYFPDPNVTTSEFVWRGLMSGSLSAYLPANIGTWEDDKLYETGTCVSYALMPTDRAGEPSPLAAKITLTPEGVPGLTCADAINPISEVSSFNSGVVYNNDTNCYNISRDWNRCYELTLSWTWPDHEAEGNISWNLYRIENQPDDIDLRFIQPILTGLENVPGETGTYFDNGSDYDGIRPYRTYYYVLTPVDSNGNELTTINYPSANIERVMVDDQHWDYNEYRVPEPPPPPEPPYGVPWFGLLSDSSEDPLFQVAAGVMALTAMLSFIGSALVLKRRKKLKRVIAKRIANAPKEFDDDFDDFFD
ncbi:MAG: hypothetical protein CXT71_02500 [Methanobacteriota archaeon]|jgi:hypothetical protein|nr:MAG: hypothetical protein CXT71_02500 [Euryarchaeota archaeon]HIL64776.1 hypothetical protein [Candidatus Poseidoniales archaeon]